MAKDNWDKFEIITKFVAAVSIPTILGIYGNNINSSIKDKELNQQASQYKAALAQKYVEIATNVLNTNPSLETKPLRLWAIDIINKYSDIKLTDVQKKLLTVKPLYKSTAISLPTAGGTGGVGKLSVIGSKNEIKPSANGNANVEITGSGGQGGGR